ncbi:MAG: aldo/keto reductase [Acidimicrobiia bacterium]|nr:aldo/keto reductase [Acidimicrobiia bacterium]NNF09643.1 aldo/keto reductase [Acidimicrobiia bacterium]NNL71716.1 aldo/keto reductase [Acidimicrobiia bacterium]
MQYRRLGNSGIQVSVLSFGSWVTFHNQVDDDLARQSMQAAFDGGINFFDNAEVYAGGESERIMGRVLKDLGWARQDYLISTKFFWGIRDGVNMRHTLNRKYLMQAIDASLERLGLDFVDLIFAHRADPDTPIEETVFAMHDIVASGKALYWGTSEWSSDEIRAAWEIAERHHLHKPQMEQPEYNLFHRRRVEKEYARLYEDIGLGTTIWSPLASGLLTGKYNDGIPEGSRGSLPGYEFLTKSLTDEEKLERVRRLQKVADQLGCSLAQLSIAWCAANPNVSTVITGASKLEQVHENLKAVEVLEQLDQGVLAEIEEAMS